MGEADLNLTEVRQWVTSVTEEAAEQALALLRRGTRSYIKADGTIVTDIDRATEQLLRDRILARFPDHAILGEEFGYTEKGGAVPLWAIDPIDGTVNLANGLPFWCVSVGLIIDHAPVLGVIVAPELQQTFTVAAGMGATFNGQRLPLLEAGGPMKWEDTYGICSASARRVDFSDITCRLRVMGSAALELAYTAAGILKGCQSIGTSLYDVAAGICLCRETGALSEWRSAGKWLPGDMIEGMHRDDMLLTAPRATLDYLRPRLIDRTL